MFKPMMEEASARLSRGEVVAFPTETFYGLGSDPRSVEAVNRLLLLKQRRLEQGLPVIISKPSLLFAWARITSRELKLRVEALVADFWPGPLTLVIDLNESASSSFAPNVLAPDASLALRLSSDPMAIELASSIGGAITSTSANLSNQPSATSSDAVRKYFPEIFLVDDGERLGNQGASTILDIRSFPFAILREGAVPREMLSKFCAS